jgi:hypothetical protein
MAETKAQKAVRLLTERRLTVDRVHEGLIIATCRGDSGEVYRLGYRPDKDVWACQCEASAKFRRVCAHLLALQHVVVKPALARPPRRSPASSTSGGS